MNFMFEHFHSFNVVFKELRKLSNFSAEKRNFLSSFKTNFLFHARSFLLLSKENLFFM